KADEDVFEARVRAGRGRCQRDDGAVVVEHPAAPASLGALRVVVEIDRAAEVDPADDRSTILIRERGHLAAFDRLGRRHRFPAVVDVVAATVPLEVDGLPRLDERRCVAGFRLRGMVVVRESVEAASEDLPDEEASPRLELANVPRRLRVAEAVVADGRMAIARLLVEREAIIRSREDALVAKALLFIVRVEGEVSCRLLARLRVARHAASIEDRANVAPVLDVHDLALLSA